MSLFLVSACSGGSARQALGLDRASPDAYAVTAHAPLEVPSNLSALPLPQPGTPRPQEIAPAQQARAAVLTSTSGAGPASAPSAAEQALLTRAGPADPTVRMAVNREAAEDAETQSGPLDWMLFWRDKPRPGVVVDAKAESDRIRAAQQSGQSPVATPTPQIDESGRLGVPEEVQ